MIDKTYWHLFSFMHLVKIPHGLDARSEKLDVFWRNLLAGRTEIYVTRLLINKLQQNFGS